ncbi:MAG: ABC transporter ATP-binding protein [Symbiobacteriia bacterium]
MALLELEGVHTFIGQYHILQGVSLEVPEGGVTVLLGRNGAGKTTTLRSIMGLVPARQGTVRFQGQDVTRLAPHLIPRLGIGYVPEDRGVFTQLTVEENLRLAVRGGDLPRGAARTVAGPGDVAAAGPAATGRKGEIAAALDRILALFPDLKDAWKRAGGSLSGGQQQMLAIARGLINDNALLLIDEPSKGLAPVVVEHLAEALLRISDQTTILLVEQNFGLAAAIGSRYTIIDDGRAAHAGLMDQLVGDGELKRKYLGVA